MWAGYPTHHGVSPHVTISVCGLMSTVQAIRKFIAAAVVTPRPSVVVNACSVHAVTELSTVTHGLDLLFTIYPSSIDNLRITVV